MIQTIRNLVWGPVLLLLLVGTGLLFTVRSGGFQISGFGTWWKSTVGSVFTGKKKRSCLETPTFDGGNRRRDQMGEGAKEPVSSRVTTLQSACTALAATIGTGNIVGVATALKTGGPGAIFWMWVSALIGMMTAYAETWLGIRHRYRSEAGNWVCGPVVYMSRGLKMPVLGGIYGLLCLLASLGMGSMVQSNAIAQTLHFSLSAPVEGCALAVTVLTLFVVAGGVGRIARVAEKLIPWAAGIYLAGSVCILFLNRQMLLAVLGEIIRYALLPEAVLGGTAGYGISRGVQYGISRGVFSNEAGLGSLAGLHGAAEDTTPEEQGMWAMFEVFFDTVIICTMTALVVLSATGGAEGLEKSSVDGAVLTAWCFRKILGSAGEYLISGAMVIFAFATMIAWYFLGRQTLECVLELLERRFSVVRQWRAGIHTGYLFLFVYAVFLGCVSSLTVVWELSDIWNGLMAFPNILALVLLGNTVNYPRINEKYKNSFKI